MTMCVWNWRNKIFALGLAAPLLAANGKTARPGEVLLQQSCTACHTLSAIKERPRSREDWSLELDKMVTMGAKIRNRKALLDYLSSAYGPKR